MQNLCLHKELTKDNSAISNCTSVCLIPVQSGGCDHTMIVPVWVRPVGEPEKEIFAVCSPRRSFKRQFCV